ncbi:MAG: helix-turn-helix transcriptional regulator [Eubacteriales bacterium]|nr:helix-turn-helix transcriptional regulator [Eubacteriales bacterium]MDD4716681.1 helix-turn-helix transcriptional regulator [Eubacteriales bacterium]
MKSLPIGERIKELRLSRKMTQQEVVGDHITRNMLSKIENNSATPSVRTLEYIAAKLGVPPGALLGENDKLPEEDHESEESIVSEKIFALESARKAFRDHQYEECLRVIHSAFNELPDEAALLAAMAYLALSEMAFAAGDTGSVLRYSGECVKHNRSGLYYNPTLEAKATMLLNSIQNSH